MFSFYRQSLKSRKPHFKYNADIYLGQFKQMQSLLQDTSFGYADLANYLNICLNPMCTCFEVNGITYMFIYSGGLRP